MAALATMIYDAGTGLLKRVVVSDDFKDAAALEAAHKQAEKGEACAEVDAIDFANTPPEELQALLESKTGIVAEKPQQIDKPNVFSQKEADEAAAFELVVKARQ